jgi:hemoglobin
VDKLEAFKLAQEKRLELALEVRAMGIDEQFISQLVDAFYLRVQAEPGLGGVFNERIGDQWPVHLAKMKLFWESIALRTAIYEGKPMVTHRGLEAARPEHFVTWLRIWEETLVEIAPSDEAKDYLLEKAKSMGARLAKGRFGPSVELE